MNSTILPILPALEDNKMIYRKQISTLTVESQFPLVLWYLHYNNLFNLLRCSDSVFVNEDSGKFLTDIN